MFVGIEIGGTKLQLAAGRGDGRLLGLWRAAVDRDAGAAGVLDAIRRGYPELLAQAGVDASAVEAVGVGFGGPTDDDTQSVITSHQVAGWDGFPLADWAADEFGRPAVVCNDADVAGLAEARFGAGRGLSPIFYVTVGTGVGGALVIDGKIYRGVGRGAAEIGHLKSYEHRGEVLEGIASGSGIVAHAILTSFKNANVDSRQWRDPEGNVGVPFIAAAARRGDDHAAGEIRRAVDALADGLCSVIALLCPRRVVVGGGVSLIGEELFFAPLREVVAGRVFRPFAGLTDIVPAALGEEVVVHGAVALARDRFGGRPA